MAYLSAAKGQPDVPVKLDDVSRRSAINRTAVSSNNGFLASIGLLEGGNAKHLTPLGVRAALTLDHPGTPEAHQAWSAVIEASPDLERVVDAVRIRQGMDEEALLSHIVLTAGVPKTARYLTGARTVVDILEFSGLVTESEGVFKAGSVVDVGSVTSTATVSVAEEIVSPAGESVRLSRTARPGVVINVHIWVKADEVDFNQLGEELQEFLSKLSAE